MKPFRERNPVPIGIAGIVVIVLAMLLALNAGKLPFISGGKTMHAQFDDASGLLAGDDVTIAGVKVGKVTSVSLEGNKVRVGMKVSTGMKLDNATRADVKIKTLLGQMYVDLTPGGSSPLKGDIPLSNTTTPLGAVQAFIGLGQTSGAINTAQLAQSFDTLAETFKGTPPYVHSSLVGLQRLSTTVASRDAQLRALLADANGVTKTLAARDTQIAQLINDSNLILNTVYQQRAVIHSLLLNTSAVSKQLASLVQENRAILGPALSHLHQTLNILNANQKALDESIHLAAPFVRDFTDVLGNGRWFETVLWNLGPSLATTGCLTVAGKQVCPPGGSK